MSPRLPSGVGQRIADRLARSRDLTISVLLHIIIVLVVGSLAITRITEPPPADVSGDPDTWLRDVPKQAGPPEDKKSPLPIPDVINPAQSRSNPLRPEIQQPTRSFEPGSTVPSITVPAYVKSSDAPSTDQGKSAAPRMPRDIAKAISETAESWRPQRNDGSSRPPEFEFTAYVGKYSGGDWNSTNRGTGDQIDSGSLPNLLYFMSEESKGKVRTNYKNVKALRLDNDELLATKPPFIFLTGTRDFRLTESEVTNLRRYIQLGGAIWGDSSVPGKNSRFDIAFRREMKRVMPDIDKQWEPIGSEHPIFARPFFPEIRTVPPGLNSYREPIEVLRFFGEIAIIYTSNDYGDMWQIGLDRKGQIDLRRNDRGTLVAVNENVWNNRETYLRNLSPDSLASSYKFGTNLVIHLLTRWDNVTRSSNGL